MDKTGVGLVILLCFGFIAMGVIGGKNQERLTDKCLVPISPHASGTQPLCSIKTGDEYFTCYRYEKESK